MAEWSKAPHSKCGIPAMVSRVQIPVSPLLLYKNMSHEIESDYKEDWDNERTACENCTSYQTDGNAGFCTEAQAMVPSNAHCDFFQSID